MRTYWLISKGTSINSIVMSVLNVRIGETIQEGNGWFDIGYKVENGCWSLIENNQATIQWDWEGESA